MSFELTDPLNDPIHAATIARLAADRDAPAPPSGLALRTVARLAEELVADCTAPTKETIIIPSTAASRIDSSDSPVYFGKRRADLFVAACVGFLVVGLAITGVQKLRADAAVRHCQNTLRDMHVALSNYADTHQGRFPTVGGSAVPQAGDFANELARAGTLPQGFAPACPADPAAGTRQAGYAYTLGFRSPGGSLVGFRRPDPVNGDDDGVPMLADFPAAAVAPAGGPMSPVSPHGRGQNVLFAGGYVRYTTSAGVGLNGDDIYRNAAGVVAAGLSPIDVCLGRPADRP
jgi:hypothetical protein